MTLNVLSRQLGCEEWAVQIILTFLKIASDFLHSV